MRLIRLATDNNANFDANFDTPINIEPNSQLALQNTTFERGFDNLEVTLGNRKMTMIYPEISLDQVEANIPTLTVNTQVEQDDFFHKISGTLNGLLLDMCPFDAGSDNKSVFGGSEWIIRRHPKTRDCEILLQLTPLLPPFLGLATNKPVRNAEKSIFGTDTDTFNYVGSVQPGLNVGDRFSMKNGIGVTTDRSNIMEMNEGISFCRGSGTFAIQIENSVDNSLGNPLTTNNGVGIGLLLGKQHVPDNLQDADVDFEMYFNRVGENYTFINGKGTARADSNKAPLKVTMAADADIGSHDMIGFTIEDGSITGFISRDDGAVPHSFTRILTDAQKLEIQKYGIQAYIYFNGTENHVKVANARITASPFIEFGNHNNVDNVATFAKGRDANIRGLSANHYNNLPFRFNSLNEDRLGISRFDITQIFNLEISESILRYLGFKSRQHFTIADTLTVENGRFNLVAEDEISYTFSDFFIVESQTLQLDSYNAVPDERLDVGIPFSQTLNSSLKGDRKSILATIPINESLGNVTFETNTPIFINIKNTNETNIRNLKFRILDGKMNPIRTTATTNMTLLIKGPSE